MKIGIRQRVEVGPEDVGAGVGVLEGSTVCEVGVDLFRDLDPRGIEESEEIE